MNEDFLKTKAYFIWLNSGRLTGRDAENWAQAEKEWWSEDDNNIFSALKRAVEERQEMEPYTTSTGVNCLPAATRQISIVDLESARTAFDNFDSNNRKDVAHALTGTHQSDQVPEPLTPQHSPPIRKKWWQRFWGNH